MQLIFLAINFIILIIVTPPPCFSLTLPKIFSDGMAANQLLRMINNFEHNLSCQRPYYAECIGCCPITEVEQHRASSVLGWETAWEHGITLNIVTWFFVCKVEPYSSV